MIALLRRRPDRRALLAAISGVDASGKGYVAARLAEKLETAGRRTALINLDGWLSLPGVRISHDDPGGHFYRHAFRFAEMFSNLVDPLVRTGTIDLTADFTEETATAYRKHRYQYAEIDVVLLEGIFLFRRDADPLRPGDLGRLQFRYGVAAGGGARTGRAGPRRNDCRVRAHLFPCPTASLRTGRTARLRRRSAAERRARPAIHGRIELREMRRFPIFELLSLRVCATICAFCVPNFIAVPYALSRKQYCCLRISS